MRFPDIHDDVIKWKHFPRYWPFVRGFHRSPVTRSFDVFFGLILNKRLSKQPWGWWFETLSRPLWRHCNMLPIVLRSGGRLSIKMPSYRYRASHYKDKTAWRPSNLYENPFTQERPSLHWDGPLYRCCDGVFILISNSSRQCSFPVVFVSHSTWLNCK